MASEDALLDAYWREYGTLREELLLTIRSRNQILSFALAASGLVLGASVLTGADNGKGTYIFWTTFAVLPTLLACIYALWCSEFLRMVRASQHLAIIERAINDLITGRCDAQGYLANRVSLSWEIYLRTPHRRQNKEVVPRWPPRQFYEEWQTARGRPGYWRGTATVDLHVPFSVVMGLFILGVQYMGNLALEHETPLWHWVPGPGFWLFLLQAYVFGHAKVVYSEAIDVNDVRAVVNDQRDDGQISQGET